MASSTSSSPVQRFGGFEVDPRSRELRRKGIHIRMQDQPLEILLLLIERKGEVVTREELKERLWPAGTFVAADDGLNTAIRKLREILGDSAEAPLYIETIPRRGYRFIGPVDTFQPDRAVPNAAPVAPVPAPRTLAGRKTILIGIATSAAIGLAILAWALTRPLPPPRITEYVQLTHDGHVAEAIGTDGSRIYFDSDPWGSVRQVGVAGGQVTDVPIRSFRGAVLDVSPDNTNLLIWSFDPPVVWAVGTLGGAPRFIRRNHADERYHTWSPDGKLIAFYDDHNALYVMGSDGSEPRRLMTAKGQIMGNLAWSPDGGRIRFTMDNALWEISSSGSDPHPLLPAWRGASGHCCGRWTPDGDFFVFLAAGSHLAGNPFFRDFEQIWALDERHGMFRQKAREPIHLVSGPIHWDPPIPSKDGTKIFAPGAVPHGELIQFEPQTKQLLPFLGGISAEYLSFSKDGSQVAYVTYPEGVLWRAKADGSERMQLTKPPLYPTVCHWSPDGTQILFTAQVDSWKSELYRVPAEGGTSALLLPENQIDQEDGNWSPDGRKIVYFAGPPGSLRIFDLDRHESTEIPGSSGLWSARWSPDGNHIAAMNSAMVIKLYDLTTGQWSTLVENMRGWGFPTWSRDGKFLYALNHTGPYAIYRIPVSGGPPTRIADLTDFQSTGAVGFWFGLDPNDRPLLLRNSGTSDMYALTLDRR
jgi:Tol biopolymer transport system component/DNA-binding winged helix-turn-helix (wHTH) protein